MKKKSDDWIRAIEAVHLVSSKTGGDRTAKQIITDRMRDEALMISADWIAIGADVGPIPTDAPEQSKSKFGMNYAEILSPRPLRKGQVRKGRVMLGGAFSLHSHDWEKDLKRWHWGWGIFVASRPPAVKGDNAERFPLHLKFGSRFVVGNAQFLRKQILAAAEGRPTYGPANHVLETPAPPRKRSNRSIKFMIAPLMLELENRILNNTIQELVGDYYGYGTQARIQELITAGVESSGGEISESTVKRRARDLMERWAQVHGLSN